MFTELNVLRSFFSDSGTLRSFLPARISSNNEAILYRRDRGFALQKFFLWVYILKISRSKNVRRNVRTTSRMNDLDLLELGASSHSSISGPVQVTLQDCTARYLMVQVFSPRAIWIRRCFNNRRTEAFSFCDGIANHSDDSNLSFAWSLQGKINDMRSPRATSTDLKTRKLSPEMSATMCCQQLFCVCVCNYVWQAGGPMWSMVLDSHSVSRLTDGPFLPTTGKLYQSPSC